MLRYFTAGESHGKTLIALIDGFPAGVTVDEEPINVELNGVEIHSGSDAEGLIRAPGGDKTDWSYYTPPPTLVLQVHIDDWTLVKQGVNTLTVTIGYPRGPVNVSLVMAQIGVVQERSR